MRNLLVALVAIFSANAAHAGSKLFSAPYTLVITRSEGADGFDIFPAMSNQTTVLMADRYKWSDAGNGSTYSDPNLYQSMGNSEFWQNGRKRRGRTVEIAPYRYTLWITGTRYNYVSFAELQKEFGEPCTKRIESFFPAIKKIFAAERSVNNFVITFRASGGKQSYAGPDGDPDGITSESWLLPLYAPACVH